MVSANRLRARTLAERHTIADSKRAFHQAFPHVIAPLYRRVADELLVELHLLSHQTAFEANNLFAIVELFYMFLILQEAKPSIWTYCDSCELQTQHTSASDTPTPGKAPHQIR